MFLRLIFLILSVPMMICGAVAEVVGVSAIPFEIRYVFPVSWAVSYPAFAFFGSGIVFVVAMMCRSRRCAYVYDFSH